MNAIRFFGNRIFMFFVLAVLSWHMDAQNILSHTVQPQETVYSIAKKYKVTIQEIYNLNPSAKDTIKIGEKLRIPVGEPVSAVAQPNDEKKHVIAKGETLYGVCKKYGVSEELMMITNPGLTPQNFRVGDVIIIPSKGKPTQHTQKEDEQKYVTPMVSPKRDVLRVGLVLPLVKGGAVKYMEFYEGFLMGLLDMKKTGISVDLVVKDGSSHSDVADIISSGVMKDRDLVIGGTGDDRIEAMARSLNRQTVYVVPFSSHDEVSSYGPNVYQVNSPQNQLYKDVFSAFMQQYKGYQIRLVYADNQRNDPFYNYLKQRMGSKEMNFSEVSLSDNEAWASIPEKTVIVPANQTLALARNIFNKLEKAKAQCRIFASPRWQSFNANDIKRMHKFNTTIYSSFYMDFNDPIVKDFVGRYQAWYGHQLMNSFPRYGVIGYDVARYFIRAMASYGQNFLKYSYQIPSDGVQNDFKFRRSADKGGFVNQNVFFVSYNPDGTITKTSL